MGVRGFGGWFVFVFFSDTATTEIYTLSLHDALPISRIEGGTRTTVASGLPSGLNAIGDVEGVADLAFVGKKLYAIIAVGCSRGLADVPAGIYRVDDGSWTLEADIGAFV